MLELLKNKRILVVVAHPDDELLGLGGTLNKIVKDYNSFVRVVILGEGLTSRSDERDKDKWNKLCKQINLADCEIADRHLSQETDKCLEWFAVLLRKYNFDVSLHKTSKAKSQKATELRSNAEKEHRADFNQWKLEGNKGKQLQSYLWYKLLSRELSLNGLPRNSKAFLDCYSYIKVSPQQLSHRNCIS